MNELALETMGISLPRHVAAFVVFRIGQCGALWFLLDTLRVSAYLTRLVLMPFVALGTLYAAVK